MTDPPTPLELVQDSYAEVLDATKHQDDKISRFLGAIAFLTGAVLVFADKDIVVVDYQLGARQVPLVAFALGAFLVLIVTAFAIYFLAMSQPLKLPGASGAYRQSHLFFRLIAWETQTSWQKAWPPDVDVVMSEYVSETLNIAERADRKYQRSTEASALVVLALFAFAIAVLLSLDVIASGGVSDTPLAWTLFRRCLTGFVLALVVFLLLYTTITSNQSLTRSIESWNGDPSAAASVGRLHLLKVLAFSYPMLIAATVAAGEVWPQAIATALVIVAGSLSITVMAIRSIWSAVWIIVMMYSALAAVITESADWQLIVAAGLVVSAAVPTLLESTRFRLSRESYHGRDAGWKQIRKEIAAALG
jgi:hypothetical protein